MRSTMRLMCAASLMLAVQGCAGRPIVIANPSDCADLVPKEWQKGVDGATVPGETQVPPADLRGQLDQAIAELKVWVGFGVDESNRRVQANGRTADAIGIVKRCEERDRQAVKAARPKVLGIF